VQRFRDELPFRFREKPTEKKIKSYKNHIVDKTEMRACSKWFSCHAVHDNELVVLSIFP